MTQKTESPVSIIYEYEMARPESKGERKARMMCFRFFTAGFILVMLIVYLYSSFTEKIINTFFGLLWFYVFVYKGDKYNREIRVILTKKMLSIRAPRVMGVAGDFPGFYNLKIPTHHINSVSIYSLQSSELKNILHKDWKLRLLTNRKLYFQCYQYVFVINDEPLPYDTHFIEIILYNGRKMLFEFDDSEKLLDALNTCIPKVGMRPDWS